MFIINVQTKSVYNLALFSTITYIVGMENLRKYKSVIMDDLFFCVDGEFDGPIPPQHSLLSFGSVAFTLRDGILGEFEVNIKPLPGATMYPSNKNFWDRNPKAYAATLVDQQEPRAAMIQYDKHINGLRGKRRPLFVEFPGFIDFMWIHWYYHNFLGHCPFGFSAVSMKTFMMADQNLPYRQCTKRNMPKRWFNKNLRHTHEALDDARGQAHNCIQMMCEHFDIEVPRL